MSKFSTLGGLLVAGEFIVALWIVPWPAQASSPRLLSASMPGGKTNKTHCSSLVPRRKSVPASLVGLESRLIYALHEIYSVVI